MQFRLQIKSDGRIHGESDTIPSEAWSAIAPPSAHTTKKFVAGSRHQPQLGAQFESCFFWLRCTHALDKLF